ncbi:LysM peptidoglycan-binding domain-containing protein [Pacificoceanicola onchidii]|uniref:LysM peptidoglycan-binding domain-containing protein n=1 Tax=Pacificoceanicola onchidii TaxID=2562685 RepID=UPI0010A2F6FF|nr:LysM domain-containing protein [Pacificoceanicola onchidii]
MMKQALFGTGFIGITLGLLWFGLAPLPDEKTDFNEVSRSEPDLFGLTPAIPQPRTAQVPVAQPKPEPAPSIAAKPAPAPTPEPVQAVVAVQPAPSPMLLPEASDDAMEKLRAMSYGIMQEMKAAKPGTESRVAPQEEAKLAPAPIPTPAPVPEPEGQQYTVKPGDSLPGIAFRFYGTTVAYFQIIEANPDMLTEPADLKAGMVLTIPGT